MGCTAPDAERGAAAAAAHPDPTRRASITDNVPVTGTELTVARAALTAEER
jgi:hypothetical protein